MQTTLLEPSPSPATMTPLPPYATAPNAAPELRWYPLPVLAAVGAFMLRLTWLRWPDVIVDFGRELYVPWRLSHGEVLGKDIIAFYGPVSPYINAGLFRLFGTSLLTLVAFNLLILTLVTVMLYALLRRAASRLATTVACTIFLALFGFGYLFPIGNFNFITPYSHDLTHGFALTLAMLLCLDRFGRSGKARWIAGAGVALGLVSLTKPEVFVAAAGGCAFGLTLQLAGTRSRPAAWSKAGGILLAAFAATVSAVVLLLTMNLSLPDALKVASGSWTYISRPEVRSLPFFRWSMGTDFLAGNLGVMAYQTVATALLFAPVILFAALAVRDEAMRVLFVGLSATYSAAVAWYLIVRWSYFLTPFAMPLPVAVLGIIAYAAWEWWSDKPSRGRVGLVLTLSVFSLLLLIKMALRIRLNTYGFVLAAPATLLVMLLVVDWIPAWFTRRKFDGLSLRLFGLGIVAYLLIGQLNWAKQFLAIKTVNMGAGADHFLADQRGLALQQAVDALQHFTAPTDTVEVVPEGVMVNYLARRRSPLPYMSYLPSDLAMFSEPAMLAAFKQARPDFVLITSRQATELGGTFFGQDYAGATAAWINHEYQTVKIFGAPPLVNDKFGVALMVRRDKLRR